MATTTSTRRPRNAARAAEAALLTNVPANEFVGPSLPTEATHNEAAATAILEAILAPAARPEKRSIVPYGYKVKYEPFDDSCGDDFAAAFSEATKPNGKASLEALYNVADANGIDARAKYGHLNPGQQRMNVSNLLRGKAKRGEQVRIGSHTWN